MEKIDIFQHCEATDPAIECQGVSINFGELRNAIVKRSVNFTQLNYQVIAIEAASSIEFVIDFLSLLYSDKTVAILPASSTEHQKAEHLFTLGESCLWKQGNVTLINESFGHHVHPKAAVILYTSGSSQQAKAVQLSRQNILSNCTAVIEALNLSKARSQLLFLPLSYSFGLLGQLLPGLMVGMKTVLIDTIIDVKAFMETQTLTEVLSGVPSHWQILCKMASYYPESIASVTHVISAGAPLKLEQRKILKDTFPNAVIYNNYGLTEASPRVLCLSSLSPHFLSDATGYPIGKWEVTLNAEQQLMIAGPQVSLGYLGQEDCRMFQNQWLETRDLAEIAQDGLVTIQGRVDNVIQVSGEKVNLDNIRHKVLTLDEVNDVVIIAVPDLIYDNQLIAFIDSNGARENTHLLTQINQLLEAKEAIARVMLVEQLPTMANGKLDRQALSQQYLLMPPQSSAMSAEMREPL